MKRLLSLFIGFLFYSLLLHACSNAASQLGKDKEEVIPPTGHLIDDINFPDAVFRNCLLATGKTYAEEITDALACTSDTTNILSIEGAQFLTNVTALEMVGNLIADVTPLGTLSQLTSLNLSYNHIDDSSNTAVLGNLVNLETLILFAEYNYELSDVSWLSKLDRTKLRILELPRHNLGNPATFAANMSAFDSLGGTGSMLRQLNLTNNKFSVASDVSALGGLLNLSELFIGNNQFSQLNWIQNLSQLTYLYIDSTETTSTDLVYLQGLSNLTTLSASFNAGITDLSNLIDNTASPSLLNLQRLELTACLISDIAPLAYLTNLQTLYLDSNINITYIAPLAGLVELQELFLYENQIGTNSILPLQYLTKLTTLDLTDNTITNLAEMVTVLSALSNNASHPVVLDELSLDSNNMADPDGSLTTLGPELDKLNSSLTWLGLGNANITDVNGLSNLTHLTDLLLGSRDSASPYVNAIDDAGPLATLVNLDRLDLRDNNTNLNNLNLLSTLTKTTQIRLSGNSGLSCAQADSLILNLGSPPVDLDGNNSNEDVTVPGDNCTLP